MKTERVPTTVQANLLAQGLAIAGFHPTMLTPRWPCGAIGREAARLNDPLTSSGVAQPSSARAIVSHSSCNGAVESGRPARRYQPPEFDRSPSTRCR